MQEAKNKKQLRILHVMSGFGGGISSFILNKAKQMPKYNVTFDVATYDECSEEFEQAIQATGGRIFRLVNPKKYGFKAFKSSFSKPFEQETYDLVHCHIEGYRAIPYYRIAKKYGVKKFYIHAHLVNDYKIKNKKDQLVYGFNQKLNTRISTDIVGCGRLAIKSVFGPKTNLDTSMVIPNSIDLKAYANPDNIYAQHREAGRKRYNLDENTLVIGHVGRLMPVKNHDKTFEIAKVIQENNLNAKILIIGSGNLEEELKAKAADLDILDTVIFTGRISPISEFYPALDVLLLPSFTEGLPTTVVEVQGAGVPTVMSNTITTEVDLALGMVATCKLDDSGQTWLNSLQQMANTTIPPLENRLDALENNHFSNEASAKLYVDFFVGRINDFQL
ncbi:glycosyltransferase [Carnobacterium sp. PL24RED07]|uniref:glycosyltransferase n=1 Tax=unclassified Carnobacterium TaxID=257487 RepID=UPI0011EF85A1|nr:MULTISPECIES: glycosyltransferase [unclassified Carnobacterium]KAF3300265.1 glycosyltransferase [Carnobacterium sp. PL26RED25]KAF3304913.1 glycosyltransferase [Carnobacterium sp. PL24RED07]